MYSYIKFYEKNNSLSSLIGGFKVGKHPHENSNASDFDKKENITNKY